MTAKMNTFLLRLMLIVSALSACFGMKAEAITATFDAGLPEGWSTVGTIYNDSDRARSGKGLYSYAKSEKTNYILTSEMEGDIEFYGRSYNTRGYGYITFYSVNNDNTLGEKLIEFRTDNVSSAPVNFQKFNYTLQVPQRIAIDLYWACIDDFTFTPAATIAGASLQIADYPSGSTFNFGGVPVSAGTTASFTMINRGDSELQVESISVTGGYTIEEGASISTIAPKESATIVIATPAADASGVLTILSYDSESPYTLNLSSLYKAPSPLMSVDITEVNFGKVEEVTSRQITISNTGVAELVASVNVAGDYFSVNPATVTVAPGESEVVNVVFNYNSENYGFHTATLTITPNAGEPVSIPLSAKVPNPAVWTEDFNSNALPAGWDADSRWSFVDGVARAVYNYSDRNSCLTTPSLTVETGDELTFKYRATGNYVTIKILVSKDGGDFTTLISISAPSIMSNFVPYTISGMAPGKYRFRFVNDDYDLDDFEGFALDMNAPNMVVSPLSTAEFGKVTERPEGITYTVYNNGTGALSVNIASNSEYFTVTPSELSDIVKDEPQTFTVNFEYSPENTGEKSGIITIVPTYSEESFVTITAHAIARNPNLWEEDFEEGVMPAEWENEGEWSVTTPTVSGSNGTKMASIRSYYAKSLITPRLLASQGEVLRFYVGMQYDDEPLTIEYSSDKKNWTPIDAAKSGYTASANLEFTAPADGYYYLRFTGTYAMLDNFEGFKFAPKLHDIVINGEDIPADGVRYAPYSASVTLKEKRGNHEAVTAKLLVSGVEVAEESFEMQPSGTTTVTLSFTPQECLEAVPVQIVVDYDEYELTTDEVLLTITDAPVLDEDVAPELQEGIYPALVLRYSGVSGWNSIALPFELTDEVLSAIFGVNYEVFELNRLFDGTIELKAPEFYEAGCPYVVYAPYCSEARDIILNNIDIEQISCEPVEREGVRFVPYYSATVPTDMSNIYCVDSDRPGLHRATAADFAKGLRGYFSLVEPMDSVPSIKLGDYVGVNSSEYDANGETIIFNLNGQRLSAPGRNGVYIINGKKVILK